MVLIISVGVAFLILSVTNNTGARFTHPFKISLNMKRFCVRLFCPSHFLEELFSIGMEKVPPREVAVDFLLVCGRSVLSAPPH